jgi:nicotinate-nucleotide adenylyltransferase
MKTGIFGSSFNPPHLGHLALAHAAKETFDLDRVIFVPTRIPPHKEISDGWLPDERLLMAHLALYDLDSREIEKRILKAFPEIVRNPAAKASALTELYDSLRANLRDKDFEVSEIEWENTRERSYTVDTLEEFSWRFPDEKFYLLIGRDQAEVFDTWKEPDVIRKLAKVVVADRGEGTLDAALSRYPFMERFPFPRFDISSSTLRERSAGKHTLSPYVAPCVELFAGMVPARRKLPGHG